MDIAAVRIVGNFTPLLVSLDRADIIDCYSNRLGLDGSRRTVGNCDLIAGAAPRSLIQITSGVPGLVLSLRQCCCVSRCCLTASCGFLLGHLRPCLAKNSKRTQGRYEEEVARVQQAQGCHRQRENGGSRFLRAVVLPYCELSDSHITTNSRGRAILVTQV